MDLGIGNINLGAFGSSAFAGMQYALYGLVILIIVVFIWKYLQYNIMVEIIQMTGSGKIKITDKACIKKDRKDKVSKLFLLRTKMPPQPIPESKYFLLDKKGKKHIKYFKTGENKLFPIEFQLSDDMILKSIPQDLEFWLNLEFLSAEKDYQNESFWAKYGGLIISGVLVLMAGVVMIMAIEKAGDMVKEAGSIATAMQNIADQLKLINQIK